MAHILTAEVILQAAVANAGTFTMPYPRGYTSTSGWASTGHVLADQAGNLYTSGFTVSFDASVITVTNVSIGTLAIGRTFRLQAAQVDTTTPLVFAYDTSSNLVGVKTPGNSPALMGARAGYPARAPQFVGGFKPYNNFQITDGGAFLRTAYLKVEAEAPFSAVRVWASTWVAAAVGPYIAVVAPTETMSKANTTLAYIPQIGGASRNTLLPAPFVAAAGAVEYGHRTVTWAAASSFSFSAPGPTHANPEFKVSDWIPCASVPRVDVSGIAASRHACMLRVFNSAGSRSIADSTAYYAELGQPWFREHQMQIHLTNGTDGVTTLTNIPASVPGTITSNSGYSFWLEFMYNAPTRHVINIGNSRQDTWPRRIMQYSTPTAPIAYTELAMPGDTSASFTAAYDLIVTGGLGQFTDVIFQGFDINTQFWSPKVSADAMQRYMGYIKKFRDQGARVFITTDFAYNTFSAANEAGRQVVLAWIRDICSRGLAILVETDPIISDYSVTPLTPTIKAIYDSGDATHINVTPGEDAIWTNAFQPVWLANP